MTDLRAGGWLGDGPMTAVAEPRRWAEPDLPAMMMAVIKGENSRSIEKPTRSTTKISAPNLRSCCAPMYARITAIRKAISATIGIAVMPVS